MAFEKTKAEITDIIRYLKEENGKSRRGAAWAMGIVWKNKFPDEETAELVLTALTKAMTDRSFRVRLEEKRSYNAIRRTREEEREIFQIRAATT